MVASNGDNAPNGPSGQTVSNGFDIELPFSYNSLAVTDGKQGLL